MSTVPHSLSFSPPSSPRRNSIGQLPLPSTLTEKATQRPPSGDWSLKGDNATPGSPTLTAFLSRNEFGTIPMQPYPRITASHVSSTHAGGIQPSASFFRPSRPIVNDYSRPVSEVSTAKDATEASTFAARPHSASSDGHALGFGSDGDQSLDSTQEGTQQFSSTRSTKQSREPLLPIGEKPTPLSSKQSVNNHERIGSNPPISSRRLVRNSVELVINLGRGLSFDSSRKSPATPHYTPSEARHAEHKYDDTMPGSPISRYKNTGSPLHFPHSLDVTAGPRSPSISPVPSFIAVPPDQISTLSAVPKIDPRTKKPMRNYQLHPSRNHFFFQGRILTGGDSPWAFIASFTIVLGLSGVWFGTTCVWWWKNESPAVAIIGAYCALIVITSMLNTATTDPGIIPRNLDPNPPYPATSPSDGGIRVPIPRDLKVRADVIRTKYCPTCQTYRPPRSSHCKMCDNCVDGCDHHCQWVNNCIGRRNYTSFFVLLFFTTTTLVLIICTSALHLYLLTRRENINFRQAISRGVGSAVAFCIAISFIWPVSALLTYHMRLLLLNITTIEQIRNQTHRILVSGPPPPNPFSHGSWRRNLIASLCRPSGYSWIDGHGIATEDKREINPALNEGVWGNQEDGA